MSGAAARTGSFMKERDKEIQRTGSLLVVYETYKNKQATYRNMHPIEYYQTGNKNGQVDCLIDCINVYYKY